ncbi:hypothetical protein N0V90_012834 [Kalmusia sp. IMI 367209]|nr:hypothetical protein N0V90_012834 [Kalmusia sp. IMI 367209]
MPALRGHHIKSEQHDQSNPFRGRRTRFWQTTMGSSRPTSTSNQIILKPDAEAARARYLGWQPVHYDATKTSTTPPTHQPEFLQGDSLTNSNIMESTATFEIGPPLNVSRARGQQILRNKQSWAFSQLWEEILETNPNILEKGLANGTLHLLHSNNLNRSIQEAGHQPNPINKDQLIALAITMLKGYRLLFDAQIENHRREGRLEEAEVLQNDREAIGTSQEVEPTAAASLSFKGEKLADLLIRKVSSPDRAAAVAPETNA